MYVGCSHPKNLNWYKCVVFLALTLLSHLGWAESAKLMTKLHSYFWVHEPKATEFYIRLNEFCCHLRTKGFRPTGQFWITQIIASLFLIIMCFFLDIPCFWPTSFLTSPDEWNKMMFLHLPFEKNGTCTREEKNITQMKFRIRWISWRSAII